MVIHPGGDGKFEGEAGGLAVEFVVCPGPVDPVRLPSLAQRLMNQGNQVAKRAFGVVPPFSIRRWCGLLFADRTGLWFLSGLRGVGIPERWRITPLHRFSHVKMGRILDTLLLRGCFALGRYNGRGAIRAAQRLPVPPRFHWCPQPREGTAKGNPLAVIVVTPGWTWGRHRLGPALSLPNAAGGLLRSCTPWSALVVWISAAGFHGRKKDPATVWAGSILSLLPVRRWHQAGWEGSPLIAVLYSPGM